MCFENGKTIKRRALFLATGQHPRSQLLPDLGCKQTPERGVICDADGMTTVAGVYAAGDASRDVQLAIIAAAEGAKAGLAINKVLMAESPR